MSNKPGDYLPAPERLEQWPIEIQEAVLALTPADNGAMLLLPFPPSANRYWRHYRGITVRSDEADSYIAKVATYCQIAGIEPLTGDIKLLLYFYRFNAARDLNNCIKVLEDALQGYAYVNDNQIAESRQIRDYDSKRPRVYALISQTVGRDKDKIKSRRNRK